MPHRMAVGTRDPIPGETTAGATGTLDVSAIRSHFDFVDHGRVVTNNAASTQPPRELVDLYAALVPHYENVHRGQSTASKTTTALFEQAYDTVADFLNAPGRECIALYRNTTEAHNAVMYALMTQVRDGDNIVTTLMEHNSNYVPWYALCREILPTFGVRAECRLVRFDRRTGELDLDHMAALVDERTKLVCCTGASNFLGTKPDLAAVMQIARTSGYQQPNGETRSWVLIDGAQLVPSTYVDVQALGVDYLSFSFHKMLAPFGVGVLYTRRRLAAESRPFLYGGDMIAEGRVTPDLVEYNDLPWKYAAGTPNILGTIASAQALRLLVDLAHTPREHRYFGTERRMTPAVVRPTMDQIGDHTSALTSRAMRALGEIPGLTVYGPGPGRRSPLVAFNVAGLHPAQIAQRLDDLGVEARAGCHCATLAHRDLHLDPLGSCRLSFYLYNSVDDVDRATEAVAQLVTPRRRARPRRWQWRAGGGPQGRS